jgi:hypothetical protein
MKTNQKSSQNSVTNKTPIPKPVKVIPQAVVEDADEDYVDEEVEENLELDEAKPVENVEKVEAEIPIDQRIAMEIEMLQNDGRFRVELLHQLQEINKALIVVAGVLVDLAGKNGKE